MERADNTSDARLSDDGRQSQREAIAVWTQTVTTIVALALSTVGLILAFLTFRDQQAINRSQQEINQEQQKSQQRKYAARMLYWNEISELSREAPRTVVHISNRSPVPMYNIALYSSFPKGLVSDPGLPKYFMMQLSTAPPCSSIEITVHPFKKYGAVIPNWRTAEMVFRDPRNLWVYDEQRGVRLAPEEKKLSYRKDQEIMVPELEIDWRQNSMMVGAIDPQSGRVVEDIATASVLITDAADCGESV